MSHFSTNEKNNRYGHRSSHSIWWARRPLAERMRGLIMYYKMEEEE
jgi:adenine-specific DNA methylase